MPWAPDRNTCRSSVEHSLAVGKQTAHRVHEFLRGERLRDVRVRPEVEPSVFLQVATLGGEHDDLHVPEGGVFADLLTHLEPAPLRHHYVKQDQIRPETFRAPLGYLAVALVPHLVVASAHQELEQGDDVRLVVDDENAANHGFPERLTQP